jgi:5-methylcytosine-specific restriction endonuclease McrA
MSKHSCKRIELVPGTRYDHYIVVGRASNREEPSGRSLTAWHCQCDCGTKFVTATRNIRRGVIKSCGCVHHNGGRFHPMTGQEAIARVRYTRHIHNANRREISSTLTFVQFSELILKPCHYCGIPPSHFVTRHKHKTAVNGIDRVDNEKGYLLENCVPCCKTCNAAKGTLTADQFYDWIARLTQYDKSRTQ